MDSLKTVMAFMLVGLCLVALAGCVVVRKDQVVLIEPTYSHVRDKASTDATDGMLKPLASDTSLLALPNREALRNGGNYWYLVPENDAAQR